MAYDNFHIGNKDGYILVEWLIALSLIIIIALMGAMICKPITSSTELNLCTQEVVYTIKKVQLWSMLGHRNERMSQGEFILKKSSYVIREGYGGVYEEHVLPSNIESMHIMKRVYFSAYGLPYDGTEFILQDTRTGAKNRIWISVQTGRIRWEQM